MTYDIDHDRGYWRLESDQRLIEEAARTDCELTVALGERLDDYADIAIEAEDLRQQVADLRRERDRLQADIAAYESLNP